MIEDMSKHGNKMTIVSLNMLKHSCINKLFNFFFPGGHFKTGFFSMQIAARSGFESLQKEQESLFAR